MRMKVIERSIARSLVTLTREWFSWGGDRNAWLRGFLREHERRGDGGNKSRQCFPGIVLQKVVGKIGH